MRHFSVEPIFPVLEAAPLRRVLIYAYTDPYYMPAARAKKFDDERDGRWMMRKLPPLLNKIVEWLEGRDVVCEYWPDQHTLTSVDRIQEQNRMNTPEWDAILVFAPEPQDTLRFASRFGGCTDRMYLEFPKEPPTTTAKKEMLWLLRDHGDALLARFFLMRRAQRLPTSLCFDGPCPICAAKTNPKQATEQSSRQQWLQKLADID
jgi:hypothetical protein